MRLLYISNFPLEGNLSPSINEMGFVESLEKNLPSQSFYFIRDSAKEVKLPQDRIRFFRDLSLSKPFSFLFFSVIWAVRAKRFAKKHGADVIIIRCMRAPLKEVLLTYIVPQKIILKSSSKYWIDSQPLGFLDKILRKIDLLLYRWLHKRVNGIECVTKEYKEFHINNSISEEKIDVIGNAIPTNLFKFSSEQKKDLAFPILGYCGAKPSERGAQEILYLVHNLKPMYPNVMGIIVGNDESLNSLVVQAKKLGVTENFKLIGQVPFREVPNYMGLFDVGFSFTSLADIVGGDSSMKLRQYLAMGIPVITFPMSNQFIEQNNFGYLVEVGDLENLYLSTLKIINDIENKGSKWKKEISEWAHKNFSYDSMLIKRIEFWQKILKVK